MAAVIATTTMMEVKMVMMKIFFFADETVVENELSCSANDEIHSASSKAYAGECNLSNG